MDSQTTKSEVIVRTSVKHPIAQEIMKELDGKTSKTLGKPYKVVFDHDRRRNEAKARKKNT